MRQRFPHRPNRTTVINDRKQRRLPPKGVIPTPPEIATSTKVTNCIELSKPPITHDIINGKRTKPKLHPKKRWECLLTQLQSSPPSGLYRTTRYSYRH